MYSLLQLLQHLLQQSVFLCYMQAHVAICRELEYATSQQTAAVAVTLQLQDLLDAAEAQEEALMKDALAAGSALAVARVAHQRSATAEGCGGGAYGKQSTLSPAQEAAAVAGSGVDSCSAAGPANPAYQRFLGHQKHKQQLQQQMLQQRCLVTEAQERWVGNVVHGWLLGCNVP
jgi:hypothetical protein